MLENRAVGLAGPRPGEGWPTGEPRVGLTRSGTEGVLLQGGGASFLRGNLRLPVGTEESRLSEGEVQLLEGFLSGSRPGSGRRGARKGTLRPASLLLLASGKGGLWCGTAERSL